MKHKVKLKNGRYRVWNLNDEFRAILKPIADQFDLTPGEFLNLYTLHRLPGQIAVCDDEQDAKAPAGFTVAAYQCDKSFWERLKRAAKFSGKRMEDYVWSDIVRRVVCDEEDMVLSPRTRRVIGDEGIFWQFELESVRAPD